MKHFLEGEEALLSVTVGLVVSVIFVVQVITITTLLLIFFSTMPCKLISYFQFLLLLYNYSANFDLVES